METSSLLVYNEVPDNVYFFIIPDEDLAIHPEWEKHLKAACHKIINVDDNNASMLWLSEAVCSKPEYCVDPSGQDCCCLYKYKVEPEGQAITAVTGTISKVFYSGFFL